MAENSDRSGPITSANTGGDASVNNFNDASSASRGRPGELTPLNSVDILKPPEAQDLKPNGTRPAPLIFEPSQTVAPIGTAELLKDETIVLHLEAETADGLTHGDGELTIHPGDRNYASIKSHVGDIAVGELKFVSPWEDISDKASNKEPVQNGFWPQFGTAGSATPGSGQDVIVPPSQAFEDDVTKTYNAMSPEVRNIVAKSGAKVVAVHHLTDAMPELKGVAPRGWPAGATWDAVDGCWSSGKDEIIVAEQRQLIGSGNWVASGRTDEVLRHETGHTVDFTIKTMSEHQDFKNAYDADSQAIPAADKNQMAYFLQPGAAGREEAAAESVADREGGATGGIVFHRDFSNTIKVVNDTINKIGPGQLTPIAPGSPGSSGPSEPLSPMRPGGYP